MTIRNPIYKKNILISTESKVVYRYNQLILVLYFLFLYFKDNEHKIRENWNKYNKSTSDAIGKETIKSYMFDIFHNFL